MIDGMDWQPEARLMFRTTIFRSVLVAEKSPTPGVKLSEIRKMWEANDSYGTVTQLFHELDEMVAVGQLYRDDAPDNTYRTNMTVEEYCEQTGESFFNVTGEQEKDWFEKLQKNVQKYCQPHKIDTSNLNCTQCGNQIRRKRICPVYQAVQQRLKDAAKQQ